MITVKVYEHKSVPMSFKSENDEAYTFSYDIPKIVETYSFKEEDRAAIQDLFSIYDPDKYMIVVKYKEPSEFGQKWLEFSTMYGGLSSLTGDILDYIVGKA